VPRKPRFNLIGIPQHVIQRGNNREPCFYASRTPINHDCQLLGPGGVRAVVVDSLLIKQKRLVINRSRRRAPNFTELDRLLFGFWSLFLNPCRIQRAAVIYSTLDSVEIPRHTQEAKVSTAIFIWQQRKTRSQGSCAGTHPGHC